MKLHCVLLLFLFYSWVGVPFAWADSNCDAQLGISQMEPFIVTPDRLQNSWRSPVQKRIMRLGKKAIPLLIECLTDEKTTKEPVFDSWTETTVGDIAFSFLSDLFRDRSLDHFTIEGVVTWEQVHAESPQEMSGAALEQYVSKHGRQYIQQTWIKKWAEIKDHVLWDKSERCFRLKDDGHKTVVRE